MEKYPSEEIKGEEVPFDEYTEYKKNGVVFSVPTQRIEELEEIQPDPIFFENDLYILEDGRVAITKWQPKGKGYAKIFVRYESLAKLQSFLELIYPDKKADKESNLISWGRIIYELNKKLGDWDNLCTFEKAVIRNRVFDLKEEMPQASTVEKRKKEARETLKETTDFEDSRGQTNPPAKRAELNAVLNRFKARFKELQRIKSKMEARKGVVYKINLEVQKKALKIKTLAGAMKEVFLKDLSVGGVRKEHLAKLRAKIVKEYECLDKFSVIPYRENIMNISKILENDWKSCSRDEAAAWFLKIERQATQIYNKVDTLLGF